MTIADNYSGIRPGRRRDTPKMFRFRRFEFKPVALQNRLLPVVPDPNGVVWSGVATCIRALRNIRFEALEPGAGNRRDLACGNLRRNVSA